MATKRSPVTAGQVVPWLVLAGVGLAVYQLTKDWWRQGAGDSVPMPGGQSPTMDDSQLSLLAERIYGAAWEGWLFFEDEEDMIRALWELGNDADVARLFNLYGIRRGPFILDAALNLVQTVGACLNDEEVAKLNEGLRLKGITYVF